MVPPASHRVSRVRRYSSSPIRASSTSPTGLSPCIAALSRAFGYATGCSLRGVDCRTPFGRSQPHPYIGRQTTQSGRFGLFPVRSPLLGESRLISVPRGTEMFQFPRFASTPYGFRSGYAGITPRGFPHSGIRGSQPACGSPRLFAACHALPRFLAPRHPPFALSSLTTN